MQATDHIFAHLGPFPYKLINCDFPTSDFKRTVDSDGFAHETKNGGTCDHCGRAIMNKVHFEAADGTRFHVGVDCAEKAGFSGFERKVKAAAKARKQNRDQDRIQRALDALTKHRDVFAQEEHPKAWATAQGLTKADYLEWMMVHCGKTKQLAIAKQIEKVLAEQ